MRASAPAAIAEMQPGSAGRGRHHSRFGVSVRRQRRPFVGDVSHSQFWEYHDRVSETLCPTLLSLLDQHTGHRGGAARCSLRSILISAFDVMAHLVLVRLEKGT